MKIINLGLLALATMLITACATTVKPSYVSPTQYQALNCMQLSNEFTRIQQYINGGVATPKRTGVGLGLGLGGGWGRGGWGFGPYSAGVQVAAVGDDTLKMRTPWRETSGAFVVVVIRA